MGNGHDLVERGDNGNVEATAPTTRPTTASSPSSDSLFRRWVGKDRVVGLTSKIFERVFQPLGEEEFETERRRLLDVHPTPVIWLFGKAQSGKTTIVRYLTGAAEAQIGSGYKPETRRTYEYDFPDAHNRFVQFLDTRGLGERDYDPAEDIRELSHKAHLLLVTARVTDHALEPILTPLRQVRAALPDRPVLLALTCLHQSYPGNQHPPEDPFRLELAPASLPDDLRRHLLGQQRKFAGLVDQIIPIDITKPEEGFEEPNFGGERLKTALLERLPAAQAETIRRLDRLVLPLQEIYERRAMSIIQAQSMAAGTAAAIPLPWVDIPAVIVSQARLVRSLAKIYQQPFGVDQLLSMAGIAGTRIILRQGVRELLKAIPFLGSAANSALAYATTFALGKACCWYFGRQLIGQLPTRAEFQAVLKEQMNIAERFWKSSHRETPR